MSTFALRDRFKAYPDHKKTLLGWVGEIPVHWGVKRLKYVASLNDDVLPEDTDPDYDILYVDISSVDSIAGIIQKEPLVFAKAPSRARRLVRNGDVIVSTVRTYLRAIAPIVQPESNLVVSTGFAVVRPRPGINCDFIAYALRAPYFVDQIVAHSVGVSYPAINETELATFPVILPSLSEQSMIVKFLDSEMEKVDALNAVPPMRDERTNSKHLPEKPGVLAALTNYLSEYRTALISAAVTGKIDVQNQENLKGIIA